MKLTASNRIQQAERDSLSAQLLTAMEGTAQWERKEAALEVQLVEVLHCTVLIVSMTSSLHIMTLHDHKMPLRVPSVLMLFILTECATAGHFVL